MTDAIPDFLRVENRKGRKEAVTTTTTVDVPEPWEVALNSIEPAEFREYLRQCIRRGRFMARWLVVDESRYYSQSDADEMVATFRAKHEERAEREKLRKEEAVKRLAAVPRRVSPTKGLVPLKQILREMGDEAKRRGHAKAAVDAAKLEHVKYHWPNSPVTLARVKQIIREYQPPVRGSARPEFDAALNITFSGDNPKKAGTSAHKRWETLRKHSGRTVGDFLAAGGNPTTLKNAIARGSAKLSEQKEKQCSSPSKEKPSRRQSSASRKTSRDRRSRAKS